MSNATSPSPNVNYNPYEVLENLRGFNEQQQQQQQASQPQPQPQQVYQQVNQVNSERSAAVVGLVNNNDNNNNNSLQPSQQSATSLPISGTSSGNIQSIGSSTPTYETLSVANVNTNSVVKTPRSLSTPSPNLMINNHFSTSHKSNQPSLRMVRITQDCYHSCLTHALTTSEEEIMGLLIGYINESTGVSTIWDCCPLRRVDKRRDRVEISPEQLVNAASMAEKLSTEDGIPTRVIGWYHSHPQFIHLPSPIDLSCQSQYQQMDSGFVGLIFSVFNNDKSNTGSIKLYAFQSQQAGIDEQSIKLIEDLRRGNNSMDISDLDVLNMAEGTIAMDVPIEVIENSSYPKRSMERIIQIQQLITEEETEEFEKAKTNCDPNDMFTTAYNSGLFNASMVCLVESCIEPLREQLKNELKRNLEEIQRLEQLKK